MTKRWGRWKKKCTNTWLKSIWRRVYTRNQNYLAFIYGDPGSGKSTTGLALCEMLDPNFTLDQVVFSVEDFFDLINSGKLRSGSAVLFEEIGLAAGNREYYSERNRLLSKITQIFRTKNLIVFYTAPRMDLADKQLLCLCMGLVRACGIEYARSQTRCRVYDPVSYDPKRNEWARHLIVKHMKSPINPRRLWMLKVGATYVGKPSLHTMHEYDKRRNAFTEKVSMQGQEDLHKLIEREKKGPVNRAVPMSQIIEWRDMVITNREKFISDTRFDVASVQNAIGCSREVAKRVKQAVKTRMEELNFVVLWR